MKDINLLDVLRRDRIDERVVESMVDAYSFCWVKGETLTQKIEAALTYLDMLRYLDKASIDILEQFSLVFSSKWGNSKE